MENIGPIVSGALVLLGLILLGWFLASSTVTTEQNTKRIIERFGKFVGVRSAGMSFKFGWFDHATEQISLRTKQLDVTETTYTVTGNSVTISAQVQFRVDDNDKSVAASYYKLQNPEAQITSHVSSAIRSKVPTMTLEEVQTNQRDIASHVNTELTETMQQYGYVIEDVLVTKADPDEKVVNANNEKYASEQMKQTAINNAEAQYTQTVRAAEADRDAMKAHGEGVALEREAITAGLERAITTLKDAVPGATVQDVMMLVQYQQWVDMMTKIGANSGSRVIFLNDSPSTPEDLMVNIRQMLLSVQAAGGSEDTSQS